MTSLLFMITLFVCCVWLVNILTSFTHVELLSKHCLLTTLFHCSNWTIIDNTLHVSCVWENLQDLGWDLSQLSEQRKWFMFWLNLIMNDIISALLHSLQMKSTLKLWVITFIIIFFTVLQLIEEDLWRLILWFMIIHCMMICIVLDSWMLKQFELRLTEMSEADAASLVTVLCCPHCSLAGWGFVTHTLVGASLRPQGGNTNMIQLLFPQKHWWYTQQTNQYY